MANELTLIAGGTFSDSNGSASVASTSKQVDSADCVKISGQTATTTATLLTFPAATGRIAAVVKNTGATVNLLVSTDNDVTYGISLPPGCAIAIPLASGTGTCHVKSASTTTTYDALTA